MLMSYPSDEVGNHLQFDEDLLDEARRGPVARRADSEEQYRELFGYEKHPFTGVDYVEYYRRADSGASGC